MKSVTIRLNNLELEAIHACLSPRAVNNTKLVTKLDMKIRRARFCIDYHNNHKGKHGPNHQT